MTARGLICAAITGGNLALMEQALVPILEAVDVVEVRLDSMLEPQVEECCARMTKPLLFTNRPTWEGGAFSGSEEDRLHPLLQAVRLQAAYVDYELQADIGYRQRLLHQMQQSTTRWIVSNHDFSATPAWEDLQEILARMRASGAHIGKIVTMAHEPADVLRVLALQREAITLHFPLIAFCMGEAGKISRLATLYLGGYMSYVAVNESEATAPGQFSARHLQELCTLFEERNAG